MDLNETLTPALSLLKEGRGRRPSPASHLQNRDPKRTTNVFSLSSLQRGEGRGEEFQLRRYV